MVDTLVRFEGLNFDTTVKYIIGHKLELIDPIYRDDVGSFLVCELKKLIEGDLELWGKKDFTFFERLCHHPIQGIACLYIVGDEPKDSVREFSVNVVNKSFKGNIVACLYTYLI